MKKIRKQITVNFFLVIVSVAVIFIMKTVYNDGLLEWKRYLGTDIIFVMITSLVTTIGWRFAENITGHWVYNLILAVILFLFVMEYGMSIQYCNETLIYIIAVSIFVFLLLYIIENSIIIFHFKRITKSIDKLSYRNEYKEEII